MSLYKFSESFDSSLSTRSPLQTVNLLSYVRYTLINPLLAYLWIFHFTASPLPPLLGLVLLTRKTTTGHDFYIMR